MSSLQKSLAFRLAICATLITPMMLISPVSASAEPSCPEIKFFGVHGANQQGPGDPNDNVLGVGDTVWPIWQEFSERADIQESRAIEAVDFPMYPVDYPSAGLDYVQFAQQLSQLEAGADVAASALTEQLLDTYISCAEQTRYLLVGYSQGAWGIDKALRGKIGPEPLASSIEKQIAGVLLLGDPAWPANQPHVDRKGVAEAYKHGVSAPYVPTRFADRFASICVSYEGDVYDPICWYDGNPGSIEPNLWAHYSYKDSASRFADQLVQMVRES